MLFNKISLCTTLVASSLFFTTANAATLNSKRADENQLLAGACNANNLKARRIKAAFLYAYRGYEKFAYGHDELLPVSKGFSDSRNGWGATIIDSLDTMLIMGLDDEYKRALDFLAKVDFSTSASPSKGFETNIRYLGGLLSAYDLRPDDLLLRKAKEVADYTLIPLFVDSVTPSGRKVKVPYTNMDLHNNKPIEESQINLAEFGTYTMEFTRLSQITGDPKYEDMANDLINAAIEQPTRIPALYPTSWKVHPFAPIQASTITVAGGGDSFYEYLIKNYLLQTPVRRNERHREVWEQSVDSMKEYLLSPTQQDPNVQFVAMISNSSVYYVSQELICFWPGNILLGASQSKRSTEEIDTFRKFSDAFFNSCIYTWENTKTDISPESWSWTPKSNELDNKLIKLFDYPLKKSSTVNKEMETKEKKNDSANDMKKRADTERAFKIDNGIYDLRPETIESVFYYYRLTGETKYQDLAWKLFLSIDKYSKAGVGYTRLDNVDRVPVQVQDFQESFFFAETLKYLYLIFADMDCISLNDYVFNTEAHPFKLPESIRYQQ